MRATWLKSQLRGTWVYRVARRWIGSRTAVSAYDLNAAYDQQTIEVMRRTLRRDSCCIDIGAHSGDILRQMIELAPEGTHDAFEPLPHLAAKLKEQFPQVRVHQVAVSDRAGRTEFQFVQNDPAYSGLRRRIYDRPDPQVVAIPVEMMTLDDAIPADHAVAFVKLDIEGGEYHALRGAQKTIERCRPIIVFEASEGSTGQYGVTPDELYSFMTESLKYKLSTMSRWLGAAPGYTREEFRRNWENGPEFYFLASPA